MASDNDYGKQKEAPCQVTYLKSKISELKARSPNTKPKSRTEAKEIHPKPARTPNRRVESPLLPHTPTLAHYVKDELDSYPDDIYRVSPPMNLKTYSRIGSPTDPQTVKLNRENYQPDPRKSRSKSAATSLMTPPNSSPEVISSKGFSALPPSIFYAGEKSILSVSKAKVDSRQHENVILSIEQQNEKGLTSKKISEKPILPLSKLPLKAKKPLSLFSSVSPNSSISMVAAKNHSGDQLKRPPQCMYNSNVGSLI